MAFTTIVPANDLTKTQHREAVRAGPRACATSRPTETLMRAARFEDVECIDQTDYFVEIANAWFREWSEREDQLSPELRELFEERKVGWGDLIGGAEDGLLKRIVVSGRAP